MKRRYAKLTDAMVEAVHDFSDDDAAARVLWDAEIKGLQVRVGRKRVTFTYFQEHMVKGNRSTTCKRLGHFPVMTVGDARKAALQEAGRVAAGRIAPGRRAAVTLTAALDDYLDHLRKQSKDKGKEATWARIATSYARCHLIPTFGNWTLAELSDAPAAVRDWHRSITREAGPIAANQCARLLRATYKHCAKLDRSLPAALPTSAVKANPEPPSTAGLAFADFPDWYRAVSAIRMPVRRSFHLVNLFAGCRPGELCRLRRRDIDIKHRMFVIPRGKSGGDIRVILSLPLLKALRIALDAGDSDLVFPGCKYRQPTDRLKVQGHALRRTYRTVAADLGINPVLTSILMSHSLQGINASYINQLALSSGSGLRQAQAKISRRIVSLLSPA